MSSGTTTFTTSGTLGSATQPVIVYAISSNASNEDLLVNETNINGALVLELSSTRSSDSWKFTKGILFPVGLYLESSSVGAKISVSYKHL